MGTFFGCVIVAIAIFIVAIAVADAARQIIEKLGAC